MEYDKTLVHSFACDEIIPYPALDGDHRTTIDLWGSLSTGVDKLPQRSLSSIAITNKNNYYIEFGGHRHISDPKPTPTKRKSPCLIPTR